MASALAPHNPDGLIAAREKVERLRAEVEASPTEAVRSAVRQRRLRARCRAGVVVAQVPIDAAVVELLFVAGWLRAEESENKAQVADAIAVMLGEAAAHTRATRFARRDDDLCERDASCESGAEGS